MNAATCSDTILQCPICHKRYRVADDRLKACCYRVRCGGCRGVFDARCVRLNPDICASPSLKEEKKKEVSFEWFGPPGATICEENIGEYTKIERVASADESSCLIGEVTQLSAVTLMDDYLTTFDSNDLPSAADDIGKLDYAYPQSSNVKPVLLVKKDCSADVQAVPLGEQLTFSEAFRHVGSKGNWGVISILCQLGAGIIFSLAIAIFWHRNEFVGFFPNTYHFMQKVSSFLGKEVHWPYDNGQIILSALEVRFDQQNNGKLLLTGVLRNKSYQNLSFPSLEVRFLDENGSFLRKEFLLPRRYLGKNREKAGFSSRSQLRFSAPVSRNGLQKLGGFQVFLR